jgi:hypothetical protein
MVSLRNGCRQKACAADWAATSFRNPDQLLSQQSLLANRLQLTVPIAPVPLGTYVSGLAVVGTALHQEETSATVFEQVTDDILRGIAISRAL